MRRRIASAGCLASESSAPDRPFLRILENQPPTSLNIHSLRRDENPCAADAGTVPSQTLAMKCLACRPELPGYRGDLDDIRFLVRKMDISSLEQIEQHMDKFYPRDSLTPRARQLLQELLSNNPKPK